jgi:hypothetical protein
VDYAWDGEAISLRLQSRRSVARDPAALGRSVFVVFQLANMMLGIELQS